MNRLLALLFVFLTLSCNKSDSDNTTNPDLNKLYFPPINSTSWETSSPDNLTWSTSNVIIPSKNMVVIRFGESPDTSLVPVTFHNEMWNYINAIIK